MVPFTEPYLLEFLNKLQFLLTNLHEHLIIISWQVLSRNSTSEYVFLMIHLRCLYGQETTQNTTNESDINAMSGKLFLAV